MRPSHACFVIGLAVPLFGCGAVDSQVTYVPESFRQKAPPQETERPPDVHRVVRDGISKIFMVTAMPNDISVSFPVPAKYGGWTTCVRAVATGISGRSLGTETFLVNIIHDQVQERRRVDDAHWCSHEAFEQL